MDISGRVWRDPEWISAFGVTSANILDYFYGMQQR